MSDIELEGEHLFHTPNGEKYLVDWTVFKYDDHVYLKNVRRRIKIRDRVYILVDVDVDKPPTSPLSTRCLILEK